MYKKNLNSKIINLLEYYSTLNITNLFSDTIVKSKQSLLINKEQSITELFKEISSQLKKIITIIFFIKAIQILKL